MSYKSKLLYHRTPSGKLKTWQSFSEGDEVWTETAEVGSDPRASAPTKHQAMNVGRSNERSAEQVAIDRAKSKEKDKLDSGYVDSVEKIEQQDRIPRAMLAQPNLLKYQAQVEKSIELGRVYSQPKLDGFRCLANRDGLWTRNLRPIDTCPHIWNSVESLFEEYPDLVIDGELYNHEFKDDFGKIQSLITKENADFISMMETEDKVFFYVYDFVMEKPFKDRLLTGRKLIEGRNHLIQVKTSKVRNFDDIARMHASNVEQGYEGTMVRTSSKSYEQNKRSTQLIKFKDFFDEEFTIVSVNEGKGQWAGYAKSITLRMDNDETFNAGCKGSMPQLKSLLENSERYEGGKATVEFTQKFPSGKPRFPVASKYYTR